MESSDEMKRLEIGENAKSAGRRIQRCELRGFFRVTPTSEKKHQDRAEVKAVRSRVLALAKRADLDDIDMAQLEVMQRAKLAWQNPLSGAFRRTVWTNRQLLLLQRMEEDYVRSDTSR